MGNKFLSDIVAGEEESKSSGGLYSRAPILERIAEQPPGNREETKVGMFDESRKAVREISRLASDVRETMQVAGNLASTLSGNRGGF